MLGTVATGYGMIRKAEVDQEVGGAGAVPGFGMLSDMS